MRPVEMVHLGIEVGYKAMSGSSARIGSICACRFGLDILSAEKSFMRSILSIYTAWDSLMELLKRIGYKRLD